jgi:hypothetical protein
MRRRSAVILCLTALLVSALPGQSANCEPVRVAAGSVLTFHLQTRLQPSSTNETDFLPKGTTILVKLTDSIDSSLEQDGAEFRGTVVSPIVSGNQVIIHAEAEAQGLLVLLRSRSHPEGFRYDLLVTSVRDHGKSYDLTASLNSSFADVSSQPASASETKK